MSVAYVLIRTTPEGVEKTGMPRPQKRDAAVSAGRILNDNAGVPKDEAQRFSATLARKTLGTEWVHTGSGYRFRIEKAY